MMMTTKRVLSLKNVIHRKRLQESLSKSSVKLSKNQKRLRNRQVRLLWTETAMMKMITSMMIQWLLLSVKTASRQI